MALEDDPKEEYEEVKEDPEEECEGGEDVSGYQESFPGEECIGVEDNPEEDREELKKDPNKEILPQLEDGTEEACTEGFFNNHVEEVLKYKICATLKVDPPVSSAALESPSNYSHEKSFPNLNRTVDKSIPMQLAEKNLQQIESSQSELASSVASYHIETGVCKENNDRSSTGKQEGTGSSGKRRRTRGAQQPEKSKDSECVEDVRSSKRRKTRWDSAETQMKLLGPLQLPDYTKESGLGSVFDTEMQDLMTEMLDINSKLERPVIHDERPLEERSPSPDPLYDDLGIRVNARETRLWEKLIKRRQVIISKLIQRQPTFKAPPNYKPSKLSRKLYIPTKQYPSYNFVGLIIGPHGNTQKRMEKVTGAKISLRGSGSSFRGRHCAYDNDDLHVLIEADDENSLDAAVRMVEKLLTPIDDRMNKHKQAQMRELSTLKQSGKEEHEFYVSGKFVSGETCDSNSHCTDSGTAAAKEKPVLGKADIFVNQLPEDVDGNHLKEDRRLKEIFCPFGKITDAKVICDGNTGRSKGYGIVNFEDPEDAAAALQHLNRFEVEGKILKLQADGTLTQTALPALRGPFHVECYASSIQNSENVAKRSIPGHESLIPGDQNFMVTPPSGISSLSGTSSAANSSVLRYHLSGLGSLSSSGYMAYFPVDLDYPGSGYSMFTAPEVRPSPPTHLTHTPESNVRPMYWENVSHPY